MVYFSAAKTITIVLILLSFPGLYPDQLQYRERKLPFDLF
jgi:hypothetical protein